MPNIMYELTMPATAKLDEVVDPFSALRRAALLLPARSVSPLRILGPEDIKLAAADTSELGRLIFSLEKRIGVNYSRQGVPSVSTGIRQDEIIEIQPSRVVGFTVRPGFESSDFDCYVAEYPVSVAVTGRGDAAHRSFDLPTGLSGWQNEDCCVTGGKDSSLVDFLISHLAVLALLDTVEGFGVAVKVSDAGGYWREKSLAYLISVFPGTNPNWVDHAEHLESLRNLAELTFAADPEIIPAGG